MPYLSATTDPMGAQQTIRRVEQELDRQKVAESMPDLVEPHPQNVFLLDAGVQRLDGGWDREFEVQELSGRVEEALARIKDNSRFLPTLLKAGLVRVGQQPVDDDLLDLMVLGDWNQVLLMVRIVTFGQEYTYQATCGSCRHEWKGSYDLTEINHRVVQPEDLTFHVIGRKGTDYKVGHPYGSTQRLLTARGDITQAEIRTILLRECVLEIDGQSVTATGRAQDIPWADRRAILNEIENRQVGPDLTGVTTQCPECDVEQPMPLTIAALFL